MKIVINKCFGGFGLSKLAVEKIAQRKGVDASAVDEYDIKSEGRADPDVVAVVEELGRDADGRFAELKVVEIPDGVRWFISEYDGIEHIAETHRTWG